jgi:Txe/YoeB family toxin of Txe-Axe toxin-antitoxin module
MSIKKELLNELTEEQLRKLAEAKGIKITLNSVQKEYYKGWDEKEKLVDLMNDSRRISISDIERFIIKGKV